MPIPTGYGLTSHSYPPHDASAEDLFYLLVPSTGNRVFDAPSRR